MDIEKIGSLWLQNSSTSNVLEKHSINKEFFLKHFGMKVLNSFSKNDNRPIMYVFTKFFKSKKIFFHEVEEICLGLSQVFKENLDNEKAIEYELIIKEKLESIREDIEFDNPFVLDANLTEDNNRLKDIRYSTNHDLSSNEVTTILDDSLFNKLELFQKHLDELIFMIDDMEGKDTNTVLETLPNVISKYLLFKELVQTMTLFPIIVSSFENLVNFLSTLNEEILENYEKRELLILMLGGLNADISNWIDTVFIKKEAEDVYYFDASFANNCLEIELQCGETKEENKNINVDEEMVSAEDLMFFDL